MQLAKPIRAFCSYARKDANFLDDLQTHLAILQKQGLISLWTDRDISPGAIKEEEIAKQLRFAQIILLLVSPDLLAAEDIFSEEMLSAFERHKSGEVRIIPIILRPTLWENTPFGKFQAFPRDGKPLTERDRAGWDRAFWEIAEGIKLFCQEIQETGESLGHLKLTPAQPEGSAAIEGPSDVLRKTPEEHTRFLRKYEVHGGWVGPVAWEPGGFRIASGGRGGVIHVWDARTGEPLLVYHGHTQGFMKIHLPPPVRSIAWNPKGQYIASAGEETRVYVWDAVTGQTLTIYQGHMPVLLPSIFSAVWSPDGQQIASACNSVMGLDETVHRWDAFTGQTLARYHAHSIWKPTHILLYVAWSPNGAQIAASYGDKTIRVWNTATGDLIWTHRFRSGLGHIAWSPDSRYLVSAHTNHTAQIWDTHTGTTVMTYRGHIDEVAYAAWSPDGTQIATTSMDRTVHVWEPWTGSCIALYRGHTDATLKVSWSSDGEHLASSSSDKTVHIWQIVRNR